MHYPMTSGAIIALALASCGPEAAPESVSGPDETVSSDLAADTASLPQTEIFVAPLSFVAGAPQLGELTNASYAFRASAAVALP